MIEMKIGEVRKIDGVIVKCIEQTDKFSVCANCMYNEGSPFLDTGCSKMQCEDYRRKDDKNVFFEKVKNFDSADGVDLSAKRKG